MRANLIKVDPDPEHVSTGMKVRLATYSLGTDDNGVEAIGFGFAPAAGPQRSSSWLLTTSGSSAST